ncbi:MAG TPA: IS30 family transposase [Acidimicrobiia bacterium]|nr:IS30 family transposase [Acidimicrobiia bacterium]
MPGARLSLAEREEIRVGIVGGESLAAIGRRLGRATSTVTRELARNSSGHGYVAHLAHRRARRRARRPKRLRLETDQGLRRRVRAGLERRLSPQVIAWRLAAEGCFISHETIYRACYHPRRPLGDDSHRLLCRPRRGRTRRRRTATGRIPKALGTFKPISMRCGDPGSELGHWEGDLIVGRSNRSASVVLTERRTRLALLGALPEGKNSDHVAVVVSRLLSRVPPALRRTLTWDQGRELARWARIEQQAGIAVFFANPRSPWQRPLVENTNALLRRWLPKTSPMPKDQTVLDDIAHTLNTMPRRSLNRRSAKDTYHQLVVASAS